MSYFKYSMFLLSLLYATAGWTMDVDLEKGVARSAPHRSVPLRDPSSYLTDNSRSVPPRDPTSYLTALFPKDLLLQLAFYLKDQPKHVEAVSRVVSTDITDNPLYWREKCKILLDRHRLDCHFLTCLHFIAERIFEENLVPALFKSTYAFLDSLFSIPNDKRDKLENQIYSFGRDHFKGISDKKLVASIYFASYLKIDSFPGEMMRTIYSFSDQRLGAIIQANSQLFPANMNKWSWKDMIRVHDFLTAEQIGAVAQARPQLFPATMNEMEWRDMIRACALLTVAQIGAVAQARPQLFLATTLGSEWGDIIRACAPLTVEQIGAVAQARPQLFPATMLGSEWEDITKRCALLTVQQIGAVAQASSQLFLPTMTGPLRSSIIRKLSFTIPTSPSEETRVIEQPLNERLQQIFRQEIAWTLVPVMVKYASCPPGWEVTASEPLTISRIEKNEIGIGVGFVASKCNFFRSLPKELEGLPLMFQTEIKAPFIVRSAYRDNKTPEHAVATRRTGEWEMIHLPFMVKDSLSSKLFAVFFKTPPGMEGQPVKIRNVRLILEDLTSLSAASSSSLSAAPSSP